MEIPVAGRERPVRWSHVPHARSYASLPPEDRLWWKHPESIVKHCPQNLLARSAHNKPEPKAKQPKPIVSAEIERLRALLIQVIKRLIKHEPEAAQLLDQVTPPDLPDDGVDNI